MPIHSKFIEKSVPAEYEPSGHVSEEVVTEIAEWIAKIRKQREGWRYEHESKWGIPMELEFADLLIGNAHAMCPSGLSDGRPA
jgi:hypothetical protein